MRMPKIGRLIAAAIIVIVALYVIAEIFLVPHQSGPMRGGGGEFANIDTSTVSETRIGGTMFYNFSVISSWGPKLANTSFMVLGSNGETVSPGPSWNLTAGASLGLIFAEFNFSSGVWSNSLTTTTEAPDWSLSVASPVNLSQKGDSIEVSILGIPGGPYHSESSIP